MDIKFVCILDFEATCIDQDGFPLKKQFSSEIIEFPSVLYEIKEPSQVLIKISEFQVYCKPVINPILTDFCTKLTGITQSQVDEGISVKDATKQHTKWLIENTNDNLDKVIIVTCGNWDLETMFPTACKQHSIKPNKVYKRFVNIKDLFKKQFKEVKFDKAGSMINMLKHLNIKLEGRHHSGLDDSRNIGKIFEKLFLKIPKELITTQEFQYI